MSYLQNYNINSSFNNSFGASDMLSLERIDQFVKENPMWFFLNCILLIASIIFLSLYKKNSYFLPFGIFFIIIFCLSIIYKGVKDSPLIKMFKTFFTTLSINQIIFLVIILFAILVIVFIKLKSYIPPPSENQYLKMNKFETDSNNRVITETQEYRIGKLTNQNEKTILDGETLLFAYNNQLDDEIPNEYTYSFWIKVAPENFDVNQTRWKPVLLKGVNNRASNDPAAPNQGNANVNINYRCVPASDSNTEEEEENATLNVSGSGINTAPPLTFNINEQSIFDNKNPGIYLAPQENKMNVSVTTSDGANNSIELYDIPLDTWFCLTIVLENKSLDCYINGKLEQTITLTGYPQTNNGNLYRTPFFGKMRYLRYVNVALTPDSVYKKYKIENNAIKKII